MPGATSSASCSRCLHHWAERRPSPGAGYFMLFPFGHLDWKSSAWLMLVIISVTIPSKLLGSGKLSKFPQSPPFYLPSGGWTGPHLPPPPGPCIVLTTVTPLASCAARAEPQAAPRFPGKEPVAVPYVLPRLPAGRRGHCPGQPAKLGPLFTSWGQGCCPR